MAQTSTKRRNILIVVVIIVLVVALLIVSYYQLNSNQVPTKLSLNVSLNQAEVIQGNTLQAQVNVTTIGKAENVTLTSNSSSGINCTFMPQISKSNFTSTLTMNVPDSTATGNYSITIIASTDKQSVNASVVVSVLTGDVTVSGQAYVGGALSIPPTTIQTIQFTDTQTGTVTAFHFHFTSQGDNRAGNYNVTLQNGHTYNVTISYYFDGDIVNTMTTQIATFTVNAPAGQTTIAKNFI